jgi:hypothetical protein
MLMLMLFRVRVGVVDNLNVTIIVRVFLSRVAVVTYLSCLVSRSRSFRMGKIAAGQKCT